MEVWLDAYDGSRCPPKSRSSPVGQDSGLLVNVRAGQESTFPPDPSLISPGSFQENLDPSLVDGSFDLSFQVQPLGFRHSRGPIRCTGGHSGPVSRLGRPFQSTNEVDLVDEWGTPWGGWSTWRS